jgi:hypothetical protein
MASSYTPLGVELMVTGENAGTWGTKTNANLSLFEQLTGGFSSLSIAGGAGSQALTIADGALTGTAQYRMIEFTGSITGNRVITIPLDVENYYILKNSTSGAYTVQFKYVSGSGDTFTFATTNKKTAIVFATANDGTNPDIIEVQTGGDVVDDTSPQLGGDLDVNGFDITSASNADVDIAPNGTGNVVLKTDLVSVGGGSEVGHVSSNGAYDLKLDTNSSTNSSNITITDAANGDITINPNGTGSFVLQGNSSQGGKLKIYEDTDLGTNYASFTTGSLSEDTTYTLPTALPSASGEVLSSTDAGVMSWAAVSGGTSWQAVKTSTFTAVAGEGYFINTTGGAFEMDLPAGSIGDEVSFIDYAGTFDTNALTIDQNGTEKIAGSTDPLTVSTERAANTLVYVDGTQGWLLKNN